MAIVAKRAGTYKGRDSTTSVDGVEMRVLKSAFQKSIRFAKEDLPQIFYQIVTVARACTNAGQTSQTKAHNTWTRNRISVIALEDVGVAAPEALYWAEACKEKLEVNPEDVAAVWALQSLLNQKKRNRDLSYLRYCLYTEPKRRERESNEQTTADLNWNCDLKIRRLSALLEEERNSTSVPLKSLKCLFEILFEKVEYDSRKKYWSPKARNLSKATKSDLWHAIASLHPSFQMVESCKKAHDWLSAGHGDAWIFFAFPCYTIGNKNLPLKFSCEMRFLEAYDRADRHLASRLESGELGKYEVPEYALDCHVGASLSRKHAFGADLSEEDMTAQAFRVNLESHMRDIEESKLHENYRKAYMEMGPFVPPPSPPSRVPSKATGKNTNRTSHFTTNTTHSTTTPTTTSNTTTSTTTTTTTTTSTAASDSKSKTKNPLPAPKPSKPTKKKRTERDDDSSTKKHKEKKRKTSGSSKGKEAEEEEEEVETEVEGEEMEIEKGNLGTTSTSTSTTSTTSTTTKGSATSVQKWSHPILENWLERPWLSAAESKTFVESLNKPSSSRRLIQVTKATTSIYTYPDGSSIFVKGPSKKKCYAKRFSAQWLASACKTVSGVSLDVVPIATRCVLHEGQYYLLMHDVNWSGGVNALNMSDWLKTQGHKNINQAPLFIRSALLSVLIFRALFKIRDTNFRNIMCDGLNVYSVDEETAFDADSSDIKENDDIPWHEEGHPLLFSKEPSDAAHYLSTMILSDASVMPLVNGIIEFMRDSGPSGMMSLARKVELEKEVSDAGLRRRAFFFLQNLKALIPDD